MVRDGRPFDAGAASSAKSVPSAPNTLGGVVAAALGRNVQHHIVGPVVGTERGLVFPAPQDVVRDGQVVRRLAVTARDATAVSDLTGSATLGCGTGWPAPPHRACSTP